MIRANAVDDALRDALPKPCAMGGVADGRIELGERPKPLVTVGRGEGEMSRRRLGRGNVLVLGKKGGLFLRGDVQHVDALAGLTGERNQTLRAHQRGGGIAPDWVRARIALDAQVHALAQAIFVLGMEGGAAADVLQHRAHAIVVLDQQRAGGGTHIL